MKLCQWIIRCYLKHQSGTGAHCLTWLSVVTDCYLPDAKHIKVGLVHTASPG